MITINELRLFGANTEEGLARCLNNETFYLRLVKMALEDPSFDALKEAMERGDRKAAFERAHALKGSIGNLALTPIYQPVSELTEVLRSEEGGNGEDLLEEILNQRAKLLAEGDAK